MFLVRTRNGTGCSAHHGPFDAMRRKPMGNLVAMAMLGLATGTPAAYAAQLPPSLELDFSTYVGADHRVSVNAAAVDADGNLVIAGYMLHPEDRQLPDGSIQSIVDQDVFIARYSADGSERLGTAWLDGDGWEAANAVAVADDGRIIIGGYTTSEALTLSNEPLDGTRQTAYAKDGFIAVLGPELDVLRSVTFLSGNASEGDATARDGHDEVSAIAIDEDGHIHVSGTTTSTTLNGIGPTSFGPGGGQDGFVAGFRIVDDGVELEPRYTVLLGGTGNEALNAIAVIEKDYPLSGDAGRIIAVAGMTESAGWEFDPPSDPYGNSLQSSKLKGRRDALITLLRVFPDDRVPVHVAGLKYGSSGDETATAMVADPETGDMFVAGRVTDVEPRTDHADDHLPLKTRSSLYPDSPDISLQSSYQGGLSDGFVLRLTRFQLDNTKLNWWFPTLSTYLGGNDIDHLSSIAFDGTWIHVAGKTHSDRGNQLQEGQFDGLPVANAIQSERGRLAPQGGFAPPDGFYARIGSREAAPDDMDESEFKVLYREIDMATYFGGDGFEVVNDLVATDDGVVWMAGVTTSRAADAIATPFPLRNELVSNPGSPVDGFVVRLVEPNRPGDTGTSGGGAGSGSDADR